MWCTAWPKKGNLGGADKNSCDTMLRRSQCQGTQIVRTSAPLKPKGAAPRTGKETDAGLKPGATLKPKITISAMRDHFAEDDTLQQNPHVKTTLRNSLRDSGQAGQAVWGTRKGKSRSLVPPAAGLVMTALRRSADCVNKRTLETEGCGTQASQGLNAATHKTRPPTVRKAWVAKTRRGIRRKASAAKIRASTSWPRGHFAQNETYSRTHT